MTSASRRRRRAAAVSTSGSSGHSRPSVPASLPATQPSVFTSRRRSQWDIDEYSAPFLAHDRRQWIPEPQLYRRGSSRPYHFQLDYAPPARVSGSPARVTVPTRRKAAKGGSRAPRGYSLGALVFAAPAGVAVCVQRHQRKEIMHAKGYAGGRVRRGRRNSLSSVRCR